MQELRWNPVLGEWVIVASHRKERPVDSVEKRRCPFCPGSPEVEGEWEVLSLPNRFPSLVPNPPKPTRHRFYRTKPARGVCEVILETREHEGDLCDLTLERVKKVVDLYAERYSELGKLSYVKYVFIFRNKGEVIGVTLHHPHSQLYALPFIPPVVARELKSSKRHYGEKGECLFCRIMKVEEEDAVRVVYENNDFICFLPFYAKWPYELHVYPKRHVQSLPELTENERFWLADALRTVTATYNGLFDFSMPYIMSIHQKPTDGKSYDYYHLHVEFYPPYRSRDKLKYPAGIERGAGTWTYDATPEEKAEELRRAARKVEAGKTNTIKLINGNV
ncbi:MAG: galactose-1-phosphate uridylyltransferase [Candidatus Jordarchaeales archaeon]|nr:galactose-1-phosphate uridylyltransferase [Candidatus Jordarchaeia archaeon]